MGEEQKQALVFHGPKGEVYYLLRDDILGVVDLSMVAEAPFRTALRLVGSGPSQMLAVSESAGVVVRMLGWEEVEPPQVETATSAQIGVVQGD